MDFVLAVGYFSIFVLIGLFLNFIGKVAYVHLLTRPTNLRSYGEWAVVTGATDGIGKCYAVELAKRGLNVLIMGRDVERLRNAAVEINECAPRALVKWLNIDFADTGVDSYEAMAAKLSELDIGILVNNVGVSYNRPEYLHLIDNGLKFLKNLIEVNCVPVTLLTHIVIAGMVKKKRGAVINVSSSLANFYAGYMSAYCASKAYVQNLTISLQQEYKDSGVDIQCVSPLYVSSKMSRMRPSLFVPTAQEYAKEAVDTIGKVAFTYGCLSHSILGYLSDLVIPPILSHFATMRMKRIRIYCIRKKEKSK